MRIAALDCGTNSLRLLIADVKDGRLTDVTRQMQIVRLGQDVDRTGRLDPAALARTRTALAGYAEQVRVASVDAVRMVATSAVRDAANRADFDDIVRSALDITADVVNGDEEARLSFAGAASVATAEGAVLVADIGGGSTELILGSPATQQVRAAISLDVGSVRLTERHFRDDPPAPAQLEAAVADVTAALAVADDSVPLDSGAALVGVAGTVTTLAAIVLGLDVYDPALIHGCRISRADLERTIAELLAMDYAQRRAIPVLHPGRVDVIAAGAVIVRTLLRRVDAAELIVSEHDILDGIALSVAGSG